MPQLKKGSKQAKDYMAKIRAMKGTKKNSEYMPVFNPYMPDVDYSDRIKTKTKKNVKKNNVSGYTKGSANFIEKGEKAVKGKTNYRIVRNDTTLLTKGGTFKKFQKISGTKHKDTKSHNVNIEVVSGIKNNKYNNMEKINGIDVKRKELEYGALYDTTLQLYLVKFANLSFSIWAVTSDGLKKALQHPEGKNQQPIVYRVKEYGIPKFERLTQKELKAFKISFNLQ